MKCPTCGAEVQTGQKYCPACGAVQQPDRPWGDPGAPSAAGEREMTRSEFCRSCASDKARKNIRGCVILCYISAAVTAVFAILTNPFMFIDAAIVLGLGLGIHLKQSRVCSVVLLAYGIFSCVVILLQSGRLGSWLIILAGVFAVIYTFKLEQEYRAFKGN